MLCDTGLNRKTGVVEKACEIAHFKDTLAKNFFSMVKMIISMA